MRADGPPVPPSVWGGAVPKARRRLDDALSCDLAIVGGGIVGLTAAELASRHGLRVCLVDAGMIGGGASGRNAAGVAPIWGAQSPDGAIAHWGAERGAVLNAAIAASAAALLDRARTLPVDCGVVAGGFVALAARAETAAALPSLATQWSQAGAAVSVLGHALADHVDSPRYKGAILFEAGGTLDPFAYVTGLASVCDDQGVRIFEHSPVTRIARAPGGRWSVESPRGQLDAATVAIAVNGAAGLGFDLDRLGWRIACQLLGSAPLTPRQRDTLPRAPTFADLDDASVFGGTVAADGRFVTTVLPGPRALDREEAGAAVSGKLSRAFPAMDLPNWTSLDGGHILVTPSKLPQMIELGSNLFAAQGCNGYGLCAGTLLGEDLARLALRRADMPARFPLDRPRASRFAHIAPALIRRVMPLVRRFS